MKILSFETSTPTGSVAVIIDGKVVHETLLTDPRSHSEKLNLTIEACLDSAKLQKSDIDLLACGIGPGSFTGIRVAIAVAKTWSYVLNKPIFASDSLSILAEVGNQDCVCVMNAFRNQVYWAAFINGEKIQGPEALLADKVGSKIDSLKLSKPILCLGDGHNLIEPTLTAEQKSKLRVKSPADFPKASHLGLMAHRAKPSQTIDWKSIFPLYIRNSEAEENLRS